MESIELQTRLQNLERRIGELEAWRARQHEVDRVRRMDAINIIQSVNVHDPASLMRTLTAVAALLTESPSSA